jgi:SET domain-containing protein
MALVIRESAIHSRGCYTTEAIRKNALIIEYVGARITNKEANDLYDDYEQTYLFGLENGKTIIDGFGVAAFINHSCRPNCRTDEFHGHIWIIADRNIKAGEELTYDYSLYDGDGDAPCRCGAPGCRGTMYDEEALKKARKKEKREEKNKK